jgi:glucose-1-phosphate adenylyltransferase
MENSWYLGTADAVFQNTDILMAQRPSHVLILSGDHIYKMDYSDMIDTHAESGAVATVAFLK